MINVDSKIHVMFPFVGTLVGGSYVSASLLATNINKTNTHRATVLLPQLGQNRHLFENTGVEVIDYGASDFVVNSFRFSDWKGGRIFKIMIPFLIVTTKAFLILLRSRPDIVHINDDRSLLCWGIAAKFLGIPVVWHVRQIHKTRLDRLLGRLSSYKICISNIVRKRFDLGDNCVEVIKNAIDTDRIQKENSMVEIDHVKDLLCIPIESKILGFAGSIKPVKRPDWVIKAGIELINSGIDLVVVIIGETHDASYKQYLDNIITSKLDNNSQWRIKFIGFRPDARQLMQVFDVIGIPSIEEPFGLVVIEAAMAKAPIVATRAGGIPEIIQDGMTGLLVDTNSYNEFKQSVTNLIADSELRNNISQNAYKMVCLDYEVRRLVSSVLDVYKMLIK